LEAPHSDIAASFDARAERYNQNEWHRLCAERLVGFSGVAPGHAVLDAGTGTGLAAVAAARATGRTGRVVAIDISAGMLRVARRDAFEQGSAPIEWVQGDAVDLPAYPSATFDFVLCAAALLYMPVPAALAEWRRLLRPGGTIAVSSMRAGWPLAGRVFRECAAAFGFRLTDPSEALGSESAFHGTLRAAGFIDTTVVSDTVSFSNQDAEMAWESNLASAAHEAVRDASPETVARIKTAFEVALCQEELRQPGSTRNAEVLFARGAR
jgi:ubiquinone/menaquinone biosynthesis C-methylase UbiE